MSDNKKTDIKRVNQVKQTNLINRKLMVEIFVSTDKTLDVHYLGTKKQLIQLLNQTIKILSDENE